MSQIAQGLKCLTDIDQLIVHQQVELIEAFFGYEISNHYTIKSNLGKVIYEAQEDNSANYKNFYGKWRKFKMPIKDKNGIEVMRFNRPWRLSINFFPFYLQKMEIIAGDKLCGTVQQECSLLPRYKIVNCDNQTVLKIKGPLFKLTCCNNLEFKIFNADESKMVGKISKKWSNIAQELFTDADHFYINFSKDLDVHIKAVLIGACILIDFIYFETSNKGVIGVVKSALLVKGK